MAAFNKFQQFVQDLAEKVHNLSTDQVEIYLSNATPSASLDAVKADLAEIATGNGYTGPQDTLNSGAEATGTYTLTGTKVVVTASGGSIGPFQYVVLQNTTPTSPLDRLIGWEASIIMICATRNVETTIKERGRSEESLQT